MSSTVPMLSQSVESSHLLFFSWTGIFVKLIVVLSPPVESIFDFACYSLGLAILLPSPYVKYFANIINFFVLNAVQIKAFVFLSHPLEETKYFFHHLVFLISRHTRLRPKLSQLFRLIELISIFKILFNV